jgi:hypothetical protein
MKKQVIIAALLLSGAAFATNAMPVAKTSVATVRTVDEKVKIKKDELPEAVKTTLAGDEYKGWEITNAYLYKETTTYEVEVKKGTETKTFKFDKDGKLVA